MVLSFLPPKPRLHLWIISALVIIVAIAFYLAAHLNPPPTPKQAKREARYNRSVGGKRISKPTKK